MTSKQGRLLLLGTLVLAAALWGCDTVGPDPEQDHRGIRIELDADLVTAGDTVAARAVLLNAAGQPYDWLPPWMVPEWSSPDAGVLQISEGRIEAVASGTAQLRLGLAGRSADAKVRVNPTAVRTTLAATVTGFDGQVVVAGEGARVRVLLFADQTNFFDVVVRARVFQDGVEVGSFEAPRREGIPVEGSAGSPYDIELPGELVQQGTTVLVEVEPEGVPLLDGSVTQYPASGEPMSFEIEFIGTTMSAYVVQAVQRWDNSVAVIASRDAVVRVFFEATRSNSLHPVVRARLFRNGLEVGEFTSLPRPAGVPTSAVEGDLSSTYNIRIPGSELQVGTSLLVEADLVAELAEGSALTFPNSGVPLDLSVRQVQPFRVRFVPIGQPDTPVGNIHSGNIAQFMAMTTAAFPLGAQEVSLRAPYHTSASSATAEGWNQIINELRVLRITDGDSRYYHGILRRLGAWAGLGYVGYPVALSWDQLPEASNTVAHEFGHNFGRWHAPCGNPGGVDPNFPYPGGQIGIFGLNVGPLTVYRPSDPDLMGYCPTNRWVSDYTYNAIIAFRDSEAYRGSSSVDYGAASSRPAWAGSGGALLVWGRLDERSVAIEPAFRVSANTSPPEPGPYRVDVLDQFGAVLLSSSFDVEIPSHAHHGERHFAFTLAADEGTLARVAELRVTGPRVSGTRASTVGVAERPAAARPDVQPATARARRVAGQPGVELRWDADRYPLLVVRDASTQDVIGMLRGGLATLSTRATALEVDFSDGVMSVRRRLAVQR